MAIIQISQILNIQNAEDAKKNNLDKWYIEYFKELQIQLEHINIMMGNELPVSYQKNMADLLSRTYGTQFLYTCQLNHILRDLIGNDIDITGVMLAPKRFLRSENPGELQVTLISGELQLLGNFGSVLILKNAKYEDGTQLLNIMIGKGTAIYKMTES